MDTQPEPLEPSPAAEENAHPKRDFWLGFIGWWVFNILAGGLNFVLSIGMSNITLDGSDLSSLLGYIPTALGCLVFLLNVGAIVFFAFRRRQVALGMLVAFGVSIAITILLGVIALVACFVIIGQYNNL